MDANTPTEPEIDRALQNFRNLKEKISAFATEDISESDTRSKIIDPILVEVLGWPETSIRRESHERTDGTYLDYLLFTTQPYIVIEAKKQFRQFNMPQGKRRLFRVGGAVGKIPNLIEAINQARGYAINKGVNYCVVTNGTQWAAFRPTNRAGVEWNRQFVLIFRDLTDIENNFADFYNALSMESATLGTTGIFIPIEQHHGNTRSIYEMLDCAKNHNYQNRNRNRLYPYTRDLIKKVFQSLDNSNTPSELIEHCYVESARESGYERGIGEMLREHSSALPFETNKIRTSKKDAGSFEKTIRLMADAPSDPGDVTLILGTVGAGKTSFLNRFRKVYAKQLIDERFLWTYVSFNEFVESKDKISDHVSKTLRHEIEMLFPHENPFTWSNLKRIYSKNVRDLKEGILQPLFLRSETDFETKLAEEIGKLATNEDHYFLCLQYFAKTLDKRILIVFATPTNTVPRCKMNFFNSLNRFA